MHRYISTLHVGKLEVLSATADTCAAVADFNMHFDSIEKVSMIGLYRR